MWVVTLTLAPIFGKLSSTVFALGLLFAELSSSVTAAIPGVRVFAGIFIEPFDINAPHSRIGLAITLLRALIVIMMLPNPFNGILWSQIVLSLQLPLTIIPLVLLTSLKKIMENYANKPFGAVILWIVGLVVIGLNIALLVDMAH